MELATTHTTVNDAAAAFYTEEQKAMISSIAEEAAMLFPVGGEFPSVSILRDKVRAFAHKKGFSITTEGHKFCCSRCEEPNGKKNKRAKMAPLVPMEKKRKHTTTRVGCSFVIAFSPVDWKNFKTHRAIKITKSTNCSHSNGCLPSRAQLVVEKRKAGTFTTAIHESQIKSILSVMSTGVRVPVSMMREMMKPLFPEGTSLDSKLIFNFRLKIKRMLAKGSIDLASHTVTEEDEAQLLSTADLDIEESPEFFTESLRQFQELLQEAMLDRNDIQQITTYLNSLAACDPTFTYRIGTSADGSITGFVWQTGTMRRDYELFGDVLFVDCLGRPLNDKGWPINTIAMLDGEKKVCLPCEGFTIQESIDGYAWMIQSLASMAPKRSLSEVRLLWGDGILAGESILSKLGIQDTCKVALDHHHLLSEDIGAWPKEFGLQTWALLKEDLTTMVKSPDLTNYSQALDRVRSAVSGSAKFSSYVEDHIHNKRHLFANHLLKTYVGNLHLQGNAPAEANHSSIVSRNGSLVVSPVELVRDLIKRHGDISAERNHKIQTHHVQSRAAAAKATNESDKNAALGLSSWGTNFYHQARSQAKHLEHSVGVDGSHTFTTRSDPPGPILCLPANPQSCSCSRWIATNGSQCSHLLLAWNGFKLDLWNPRWHQREQLGVSFETAAAEGNDSDTFGPMVDDDDDDLSLGTFTLSQESNSLSQVSNAAPRVSARDSLDLTRQLGFSIGKIRDREKQTLLLGAVVKLNEIAKGNLEQVSGQSLEEILNNQLCLFTRNMPSQTMFSQDESNKENSAPVPAMRAAAPTGTNGGSRLRSANERLGNSMRNSKKRPSICSLCLVPGHKVGRMCTIVQDWKATLVAAKDSIKFAKSLGNPNVSLVETPDTTVKASIKDWTQGDYSIPSTACHIIAKRLFFSAKRKESSFQVNVVEVIILDGTGAALAGHAPAYFPAWVVSAWIEKHCTGLARKKHVLSCLVAASDCLSQEVYEYSP
jgi:hypothetical protein